MNAFSAGRMLHVVVHRTEQKRVAGNECTFTLYIHSFIYIGNENDKNKNNDTTSK